MPKLRRRLRTSPAAAPAAAQLGGLSLQALPSSSSSQSVAGPTLAPATFRDSAPGRPSLTLNLGLSSGGGGGGGGGGSPRRRAGLGLGPGLGLGLGLSLNLPCGVSAGEAVDIALPLERQGWYHGAITRLEAENILRLLQEGSYLVRNSESTRQDYSLSLKSARGFMHMRIQQNKETGKFILGQFSKPFDSIPEMIHHYTINRLPIRGAEHMCLLHPVIEQLL